MGSIFLIIGCLMLDMLTATTGWAHGIEGNIEKAEGYCAAARYDDGEPVSYAEVTVTAPDSQTPFQKGRTDRNGRFLFQPDGQGRWEVVITDGMGHQVKLEIKAGEAEKATAKTPAASGAASRPLQIITGLSVIFGLFGLLAGWKAHRSRPA